MKRLGLLLSLLIFGIGELAAVELAPGLVYLRPGTEIAPQTGSVVIDLRTVTDEAVAAPMLTALEPGNNNERRIVLALVSPETPAGLRRQLAALKRCITIGRAEPDLKTDIIVTASAETDRRASAALAAGTAPEKLLVENADKPRYDEATLMREHTTGIEPASPESPKPAGVTPAEPPLFDTVLQRAVHIYRGLVILKKS